MFYEFLFYSLNIHGVKVNMPAKVLICFFYMASSNCGIVSLPWKQIALLLWQTLREFSKCKIHLILWQEGVMPTWLTRLRRLWVYRPLLKKKSKNKNNCKIFLRYTMTRPARRCRSSFPAIRSHTKATPYKAHMKISPYLIQLLN